MYKINIFILFIILSSCQFLEKDDHNFTIFKAEILKSLSFENSLKVNERYFSKGEVSRPIGTWVRLLETERFCLDYKIPLKKESGELVISRHKGKCEEMPVKEYISKLEKISGLKVDLKNDYLNGKKLRKSNYGLNISFKYLGNVKRVSILNYNLDRSKTFEPIKYGKYDSHATYRWQKGLRITLDGKSQTRSSSWEGSQKNDYQSGKINFCYRVDQSCKVVKENTCDECLHGWTEVVDMNCAGGGSKICAPLDCGKKGLPACKRGTHWKGMAMEDLCFNDSPAGYCEEGLKTICDSNKILICI